jgi:hypothetical protein
MEIPLAFRVKLRKIIDDLKEAVDEMVSKRWVEKKS